LHVHKTSDLNVGMYLTDQIRLLCFIVYEFVALDFEARNTFSKDNAHSNY